LPERIYLDHAATSPLRPEAKAAMEEGFRLWANPSSPHAEGRKARAALEDARERIKAALGWDGELIFTSGASEALAIGLGRAKVQRRIVSAVEHDAVFRAAPDAEVVPVIEGAVSLELAPEALEKALSKPGRSIVALQAINPETGTNFYPTVLHPQVKPIKDAGALLLVDCSQVKGKIPVAQADMAVVSAHKIGGPVGIGALLVKDLAMLEPSGGQERGYRSGTENLPAVLGFAAAVEQGGYDSWKTDNFDGGDFYDRLWEGGTPLLNIGTGCRHIFPVTSDHLSAQALLIRLDAMGIAVSAGSACSSGSLKPSRVLKAFGIDDETASRTIRVSIGWSTTWEELEAFAEAWKSLA